MSLERPFTRLIFDTRHTGTSITRFHGNQNSNFSKKNSRSIFSWCENENIQGKYLQFYRKHTFCGIMANSYNVLVEGTELIIFSVPGFSQTFSQFQCICPFVVFWDIWLPFALFIILKGFSRKVNIFSKIMKDTHRMKYVFVQQKIYTATHFSISEH